MTVQVADQYVFRCPCCWEPIIGPQELAGSLLDCCHCGAEIEAPEVTERRMAMVEEFASDTFERSPTSVATPLATNQQAVSRPGESSSAIASGSLVYPQHLNDFDLPVADRDFSGHPLASRTARLIAYGLDGLALILAALIGVFAMVGMENQYTIDFRWGEESLPLPLLGMIGFFPLALSIGQWNMIATRGQSIGKLLLGIRIVTTSGKVPGFFAGVVLRSWLMQGLYLIPFVQLVDWLLILGGSRRCLHDLLAGTRVVEG